MLAHGIKSCDPTIFAPIGRQGRTSNIDRIRERADKRKVSSGVHGETVVRSRAWSYFFRPDMAAVHARKLGEVHAATGIGNDGAAAEINGSVHQAEDDEIAHCVICNVRRLDRARTDAFRPHMSSGRSCIFGDERATAREVVPAADVGTHSRRQFAHDNRICHSVAEIRYAAFTVVGADAPRPKMCTIGSKFENDDIGGRRRNGAASKIDRSREFTGQQYVAILVETEIAHGGAGERVRAIRFLPGGHAGWLQVEFCSNGLGRIHRNLARSIA